MSTILDACYHCYCTTNTVGQMSCCKCRATLDKPIAYSITLPTRGGSTGGDPRA